MLDREIINALLEIKAVELRVDKENWFTWASGIKSPIYCDNRLTSQFYIITNLNEKFLNKNKENLKKITNTKLYRELEKFGKVIVVNK